MRAPADADAEHPDAGRPRLTFSHMDMDDDWEIPFLPAHNTRTLE